MDAPRDATEADNVQLAAMLANQKRVMKLRREAADLRREAQAGQQAGGSTWWEADCPPNMVNVADVQQLEAALTQGCAAGRLVVVSFFSPECYACRSMQPKLQQIATAAPGGLLFLKVNGSIEQLQPYCDAHGVTKIPYFHLYRGGRRVAAFTANMQPEKLKLLRARIAEHLPSDGGSNAAAAVATGVAVQAEGADASRAQSRNEAAGDPPRAR